MEENGKIRLGLIGLGQRGNTLLPNILANEDVTIDCICDKFEDRITSFSKNIEEKGFPKPFGSTSFIDILDRKPDCIIVAPCWTSHDEVNIK